LYLDIFTNCETSCIPLENHASRNLHYLQRIGKNEGQKKTCDIIIPVSLVAGGAICYVFQHLTTIKTV
jgi:hypothetical protein